MAHVIVAGATGYLGRHLVTAFLARGLSVSALVRPGSKAGFPDEVKVLRGEATRIETLDGLLSGADLVISALGLTRQADRLSYREVDYQANHNLLAAAQAQNVQRFAYVHVLTRGKMTSELIAAKSRFVATLQAAPIPSLVIRPGGYFSDLAEVLSMAKSGRVWLVGDGEVRLNPIHGADLAVAIVDAVERGETDVEIGGPEVLSMNEIAAQAFAALGRPAKVSCVPRWVMRAVLGILKPLAPRHVWGPLEFFLAASSHDMIAPAHGDRRLGAFFREHAG